VNSSPSPTGLKMIYRGNGMLREPSVGIRTHGSGYRFEIILEAKRTSKRERVTFNGCSYVERDIAKLVGEAAVVWMACNKPPGRLEKDELMTLRRDFNNYWRPLPRDATVIDHPRYKQYDFRRREQEQLPEQPSQWQIVPVIPVAMGTPIRQPPHQQRMQVQSPSPTEDTEDTQRPSSPDTSESDREVDGIDVEVETGVADIERELLEDVYDALATLVPEVVASMGGGIYRSLSSVSPPAATYRSLSSISKPVESVHSAPRSISSSLELVMSLLSSTPPPSDAHLMRLQGLYHRLEMAKKISELRMSMGDDE